MTPRHFVLCAPFLLAALAAQGVVRQVPGTYATIPAAIASSSPGDIIEIGPGIYPAFDCAKGVTLRAAPIGSVTFNLAMGFVPSTGVSMFFAPPVGETVHVIGVTFRFPDASPTLPTLDPRLDLSGRIVLEDCTLTSSGSNARGRLQGNAGGQVHLQNVTTRGPVVVADGKLTAVQCDLRGPFLQGITSPAMVANATLQASHCTIVGGSSSTQAPGAALQLGANATAWVTDSAVDTGTGVPAACAVTGGTAVLTRCTSNTPGCLPTPSNDGVGVRRWGPILVASTWGVDLTTEPGFPIGIHASFELGDFAAPIFAQPWCTDLGASFDLGIRLADGAGDATFAWSVPANPSILYTPVWLHAFSGWTLPLQLAPPVGGVIR